MLKFLLILGIVAYILYKIGTFFFRAGVATQQMRDQETTIVRAKNLARMVRSRAENMLTTRRFANQPAIAS
ncbi:MAG: hypothetical protein ACKO3B_00405 [Bacteroidota bacterium]